MTPARFTLATPPLSPHARSGAAAGALAAIELRGDIDAAFAALHLRPVAIGCARLRRFGEIDEGVVARWSQHAATLMPHGGPAVVRGILEWLASAGLTPCDTPSADLRALYPEAADDIEARMLAALARAASPLAVDLLLDQPRRWREADSGLALTDADAARSARLNRLIDPPLVVAFGRPNIGKSTLLNALAGRGVALVADAPGTTRDAVGAMLDLAGLTVRYLDTAGVPDVPPPAGSIEDEAMRAALDAARSADLLLLCGDATATPLDPPSGAPSLRVRLRADLAPAEPLDRRPALRVCAVRGEGLAELVSAIREALVPSADLAHPGPWRFWP